MPKRTDIKKIMLIGSGPIVIGQACEFDYSGTQACKALKEENFKIILINSNPATIMTDPQMADQTYIEPITPEIINKIIEKERPDALLPTLGGQTGLNIAVQMNEMGILKKFGVKLIGASIEVIKKAEDRELFKLAMHKIGMKVPQSIIVTNQKAAILAAEKIGFPVIVKPSFTLAGTGGGIAYNKQELVSLTSLGLDISLIHEIMIEEFLIGWKEFELELMRDKKDNVIIICSIENLDTIGVHTGDSIAVAPAQTLTDKEYQKLRNAAISIIREIGVDTGGSNVQFAVNPKNGKILVIEMNPRVSRSSALASKATGFPIAKIATKLAIGYSLDELKNDITRKTVASFEPTIDYCVVKIPRWNFEKFPDTDDLLTTAMKSVGEIMAIGRTFKEALQKGLRSLEIGRFGLGADGEKFIGSHYRSVFINSIKEKLVKPNSQRIFYIHYALSIGIEIQTIQKLTGIDPWFLYQIFDIIKTEVKLKNQNKLSLNLLQKAKIQGFSDLQIAHLQNTTEDKIRDWRKKCKIEPVYKLVDTCAAEFLAYTPYYYSTYEKENESKRSIKSKVIILGSGPNRIGQGIEFDYCCVQASLALREEGFESIIINSNPETVSTDYDTSDKLYFEPLTKEDVLNIVELENPKGIIIQFGGQTPINLLTALVNIGVKILGTSPLNINFAEDRKLFRKILQQMNFFQPKNDIALNFLEAKKIANFIGYPVLIRPSYVLGGRAMQIAYDSQSLYKFIQQAINASPGNSILIEEFLEDALEVDVDAISDGEITIIGGIMEHIEAAGIHSGDSACVLPPHTLPNNLIEKIKFITKALAKKLNIIGLLNIQFAIKNEKIYILEVNPRASRTIPFVSKAIGLSLVKLATKVMLGKKLCTLGFTKEINPLYISVKEAVFSFNKFPNVDILLGPEMKSTGEVMGIDFDFGLAFAKAQLAADQNLPLNGTIFISVKDSDKLKIEKIIKKLYHFGFKIFATKETSIFLKKIKIPNVIVKKIADGKPNVIDFIKTGLVQLVISTSPSSYIKKSNYKNNRYNCDMEIRRTALHYRIPYATTIEAAKAITAAIESLKNKKNLIFSLQEYHKTLI